MLSAFSSLSHGGQTFDTEDREKENNRPLTTSQSSWHPTSESSLLFVRCSQRNRSRVSVKSLSPRALSSHLCAAPHLLSEVICCGADIQSSRLAGVCPAITPDKMFLFWRLYIWVAQAWSWPRGKVNAAAGAAGTWWKVIQYTGSARARATQRPHVVKQREETEAPGSVYF